MNKQNIILSAMLALGALTASAQVKLSFSDLSNLPELAAPATRGDVSSAKVDMILNVREQSVLDKIREQGGEIVSEISNGTVIVNVDLANASSVAALRGVRAAELPRLMKLTNDQARIFSNVEEILNGSQTNSIYDGTGVVVGLFDIGIDPNHINFKDKDGNTRVKMWLRYSGMSSIPKIADTPEDIAAVTTDSSLESHGTHTAGTMTGSCTQDWGDGVNFSGVAPGADIIMAGGTGYSTQILDAVQRIAQYAREQEKPCVINLSFGDNIGPHDGTDAFTKALNDVAVEYDAVICLSSGNERKSNVAIIKQLPEEKPVLATLAQRGPDQPTRLTTQYYQTSGQVQIWTTDNTPFEVTLDVIDSRKPDEVLYSFAIPEDELAFTDAGGYTKSVLDYLGMTDYLPEYKNTADDPDFTKYYEKAMMGGSRGVDPTNSRYMADIYMFLNAYQASVGYNYVRITVKGKPGQKIFMYADGSTMILGNRSKPTVWDAPDGNGSNSNMGSGEHTICVGSYLTNNISGSGYPTGTIGDVSYFSSYGETPDGRIMPDICAPGQVIVSSRNSYLSTSSYYYPVRYKLVVTDPDNQVSKEYYWTTCAGTSMSSPHMAGIAALWRQADPTLSYQDIKEIARTTAVEPGFTSPGWGCGKVDALAGLKKILGMSSVYDIMESAPESIMIENLGGNVYDIFAPTEKSVTASVINLQGVSVISRTVEGESMNLDLNALPSGIYLLQVTAPHGSRTLKIRR